MTCAGARCPSRAPARDYGVVASGGEDAPGHRRRRPPTGCAPSCARARPAEEPFFDRGPGYARLAEGRATAEVDWL